MSDLFGSSSSEEDDDNSGDKEKGPNKNYTGKENQQREKSKDSDNEFFDKIAEVLQFCESPLLLSPILSDEELPQTSTSTQNDKVAEATLHDVDELPGKDTEQTKDNTISSSESLNCRKADDTVICSAEEIVDINAENAMCCTPAISEPMDEDKAPTVSVDMKTSVELDSAPMESSIETQTIDELLFGLEVDANDNLIKESETESCIQSIDRAGTSDEIKEETASTCTEPLNDQGKSIDPVIVDQSSNADNMPDLDQELMDDLYLSDSDSIDDDDSIDDSIDAETLDVPVTSSDSMKQESSEAPHHQSLPKEPTTLNEQLLSTDNGNVANIDDYSPVSPKAEANYCTEPPSEVVLDTEQHCESIDDYSPASPKPETNYCSKPPREVFLDTEQHCESIDALPEETSLIDQLIHNYSTETYKECMKRQIKDSCIEEAYLLASLRNAIETYCAKATPAHACVDQILLLTRRPIWMAASILEVVENTREPLSMEFTPPAPAMPSSLQKILVLITHLDRYISGFAAIVRFELEQRLFQLNRDQHIVPMVNLAQFFTGLIDIERPQNKAKVRLFIYKSLYYFTHKAVPLVFTVIMAHPDALPHANEVEFSHDPLVRMFAAILSNITYTNTKANETAYRKTEMFITLKRRFGFFAGQNFLMECAIDFCIKQITVNRLKNVSYALILASKRLGVERGLKEIVEKQLIPLLHQYFSQNISATNEYDQQIAVLITTISSIVKTLPANESVDGFLDIFSRCLHVTDRQMVQEAAVTAICQMSRFGIARVYSYLKSWRPNYRISGQVQAQLRTLVYRKPTKFWYSSSR